MRNNKSLIPVLILLIGGFSFISTNQLSVFALSDSVSISNMSIHDIIKNNPFFVENGSISTFKDLGGNKTEFTYSGNGTLNNNTEVKTNGTMITNLIDGTIEYGKGNGHVITLDGKDDASYDIIYIQNITKDNKLPFVGSIIWKTNHTSQIGIGDNFFGILKGESDETTHNYAYKAWGWK